MEEFVKVAQRTDIEPGGGKLVEVDGERIALFNLNGTFYAIGDTCTHAQASLSEGELGGDEIECPLHGACFNIKTGEATTPPAVTPVKNYTLRLSGDDIEISVSE